MKLKSLMLTCLSLLLLSACEGGDRQGQGSAAVTDTTSTFKWRLVTTWPKNFPGMGMAPEQLADRVRMMSRGRLDIKVYGAGELVPAFEVFEAVSQGSAQMGHGAAYYWKGKLPASQFFTAVPFGLTAQEMNGWLLHGGGMELWREYYGQYGLMPIAGGNTGVQMAGWFNREIDSLADLRGLKMRMPGLGGEVLNRVGGTAVDMPGGEIFTSMQTGVIDAAEWVGPYNDLAFGLHQVAEYYYYPGWQEAGPNLEFTVNMDAWNSLPTDLQAILETAALAVNSDLLAEYTARNNAALTELRERHGVQVRRLPDDVLAEIAKVSEEVIEDFVSEAEDKGDNWPRRVHDSWSAYREGVMAYHEISERAFINARADYLGKKAEKKVTNDRNKRRSR